MYMACCLHCRCWHDSFKQGTRLVVALQASQPILQGEREKLSVAHPGFFRLAAEGSPAHPPQATLRIPQGWCCVEAGMMQCLLTGLIDLIAPPHPIGRDHHVSLLYDMFNDFQYDYCTYSQAVGSELGTEKLNFKVCRLLKTTTHTASSIVETQFLFCILFWKLR